LGKKAVKFKIIPQGIVPCDDLTRPQLVKKFPVFCGTQAALLCLCKPEAAYTVRAPDDERYAA
jgi:hypothetical protein